MIVYRLFKIITFVVQTSTDLPNKLKFKNGNRTSEFKTMALKNTALKNGNAYDDRFKTILFETNSNTNICDSPRVEKLTNDHHVLRK